MDGAPEATDPGAALIVVEPASALEVYSTPGGLDPYLERIRNEVAGFVADPSTAAGRAAIRSMAYRVTRSKTYLDDVGKALTADLKELPRKIDASRKLARDTLEALAAEVRAPVTAWEAEQERIKAKAQARADAEALALRVDHDHEVGLLLNAERDRRAAEARARAEAEAVERERVAREEGERRAREEAEAKVVAARVAAERAEREKAEAVERAARAEREAAARAERAVEDERRRAEADRLAEAEQQRIREADKQHTKEVNRAALASLLGAVPSVTEEEGKSIIRAIIAGHITHVSITY